MMRFPGVLQAQAVVLLQPGYTTGMLFAGGVGLLDLHLPPIALLSTNPSWPGSCVAHKACRI